MLDKVSVICPNIGIVYSGMGPDFRILVARARKSAQAYWRVYGEYPPTRILTQEIATIMQEATQSGCVSIFVRKKNAAHDMNFADFTVVYGHSESRCSLLDGTRTVGLHCIKWTPQVRAGRGRRVP